jgi:hypothetical protein
MAATAIAELALIVGAQGLRAWADFQDRAAKGQVTEAELDTAAKSLDMNIDGLREDIAKAKAEGR